MRKSFALLLVLVFLTALCLAGAKPASGVTATENTWVTKAPMHEARGYLGAAVVNGKIYAIGGDQGELIGNAQNALGMTMQVTNVTEEYDPNSDTWVSKSSMLTARARFGTAVYQNRIYCIGGYNWYKWNNQYNDLGNNEVYDPVTDTWESKAPLPTPRHTPATNMVDGKIYVIGGYSITTHSILNVAEVYDPATDTWATKTPPPLEVGSSASAVIDNKIYVLGQDSNANWRNIIQIYDPETDNWSIKASSPVGASASAVATTGLNAPKRIYFFTENRTDVYDPANDSWIVGTPAPTLRPVASAAVIDDLIYVVGGRTGQWGYMTFMYPSALNEQYTPIGDGAPDTYVPPVDSTPPKITILSPLNQTYNESSVPLVFVSDKPLNWTSYSLDGKENVTVTGNASLAGLSNGMHTLVVYANDTFGNMGASETVNFIVAVPEPEPETFPVVPVAAVAVVAVVAACAGLLFYFKKRKR